MHPCVYEYPGCFASSGFPPEMRQDLPSIPPHSGTDTLTAASVARHQPLLNTVFGGRTQLACHRTTRRRLSGLLGCLWAKGLVQSLYKSLPSHTCPKCSPGFPTQGLRALTSGCWPKWRCGQRSHSLQLPSPRAQVTHWQAFRMPS